MSTFAYIPSSLVNCLGDLNIDTIYACADKPQGFNGPLASSEDAKTNHWVFYCAISREASIRIDPTPGGLDYHLVSILTREDYRYDYNAAKIASLGNPNLTVKQFIDLIQGRKYDRYRFSSNGTGCRLWVHSIIKLLQSSGHLQKQSEVEAALDALTVVWCEDGAPASSAEQTPIDRGTFYALED